MRAELHVHSTYSSDGRQTVAQILERCRALGLGAVAITDHNSVQGSLEALRENRYGLIVLTGTEVSTAQGHVLAYNIFEPIPAGRSVEETLDIIHEAGGIAVAPHPFRAWSGLGRSNILNQQFDGVEVINSRSLRLSNDRASRLATQMGVANTGGSDSHSLKTLGRAYTVFPESCTTAEDMVRAIRSNKTRGEGSSKPPLASLANSIRNVGRWLGRGFRRI